MSDNWAEAVAEQIAGRDLPLAGRFLLLGAADTGKTTLLMALANRLARSRPVALVDADIGPSHIGPPTTVGWTVIDNQAAVGVIERWRPEKTKGEIRAPRIDMQRVRCVTIGDTRIPVPLGWS